MKRVLDTNICIYIIKKRPIEVLKRFKEFDVGDLALTSITVAELTYGAYKSQHQQKNLKALEDFFYPFDFLDFDEMAAREYGMIRASLESSGQVIGGLDMLIAAIVKAHGYILVTNNVKEFERVEGLKIENWT